MHGECEVPVHFYVDAMVKRCFKMVCGYGPDQVWTRSKLAEDVFCVYYRVDFLRFLKSALCSSGEDRGSFPEQRLVIDPRSVSYGLCENLVVYARLNENTSFNSVLPQVNSKR